MKKLLLASTIIFTTTLAPLSFNETKIEAKAKSEIYPLSNSFVTSLKNGQLRNSKVTIGMSAKEMKKVASVKKWQDTRYSLKKPAASGADVDWIELVSKTKKVATISRNYNYTIGKSTVDKKLGKPYKVRKIKYDAESKPTYYYFYKVNSKYNVAFGYNTDNNYKTTVIIGDKKYLKNDIPTDVMY